MPEVNDQEKTEEPSQKRRDDARKKGQVPKSRDLTTFVLLMSVALVILSMSKYIVTTMVEAIKQHFILTRDDIFDVNALFYHMNLALLTALKILTPIFIVAIAAVIIAAVMMSGWNFSTDSLGFKFERMNPIAGIKRIFTKRSIMELVKSTLKILIISVVAILYLKTSLPKIMMLSKHVPELAMMNALSNVLWGFIVVTASMSLLLFIDVPYQWWEYIQQLRMTKQELKDEFKESEANPQVKQRIRQIQRQMSQRAMLKAIPQADVVITNPTHYAVALSYKEGLYAAPVVVAKGVDTIAEQIRKIATEHDVLLVSTPPLARSLYYHASIDREIPVGLYVAVAQVLAYVYQLKRFRQGEITESPMPLENLPIPDELVR